MWLPGVQGLYGGFVGCFKGVELLDDLTKIFDYTNETLMIVEGYGGGLHPVLVRTLVLESLERINDFAGAYAGYIGESMMRVLCDELKGLLEVVEDCE
ncbi:MAG: hypothetical protein L2C94_006550 [Aigarchaeota archaeon]|nr:hypothetical protein [Candidatus Wolframiiraptor gerlachensis]